MNVPEFKDLNTSTCTVMVYGNIEFDIENIFKKIRITPVDVPRTKKKKNVDKKSLKAPYGAIVSVQKGVYFRGVDMRKRKKYWCYSTCQITKQRGKKTVKVNTVEEEIHRIPNTDIYEIKYFCTSCKNYYEYRQLKKIMNFLNQITIDIALEDIILNVMMFKNNFKIAGCKKKTHAIETAMILWQDYLPRIDASWSMRKEFESETPSFIFRTVMRNVDFRLGFPIDRESLNQLMNSEEYSDRIFMSQCETTSHTNVNIKMYQKKPQGYMYKCLVFPPDEEPYFELLKHNPYKPQKKKKSKYITFIVFSSSEIIVTGKFKESMDDAYRFFVKEILKNRELIEEKIEEPDTDLLSFLGK